MTPPCWAMAEQVHGMGAARQGGSFLLDKMKYRSENVENRYKKTGTARLIRCKEVSGRWRLSRALTAAVKKD